jgi:glucoside 3-dehydrogenase (cytochrome c) hitch-hiker subunit
MSDTNDLTRREALKIAAAAVVVAPAVALRARVEAAAQPRFFTPAEFRLVDELTEILIPADAHSGGARAAGAAAFIDKRLAELVDDEPRALWRAGLARVDALAREMHGQAFLHLTPDDRVAVVTKMAGDEEKPTNDEERFFGELKTRTVHAYYTSKIGIHDELEYKGNTLLNEFVGEDISKSE